MHCTWQHHKFNSITDAVVWLLAHGNCQFLVKNQLSQYLPPADRRRLYDTPDTSVRNINPNIITVTDEEDEVEEELPQASGASDKLLSLCIHADD